MAARASADKVGPHMTDSLRLKIVHDDQMHRKCLADALAATGHFPAIEFAASAEEAQESLHDHPADVFLIDWGLPHERALELTRHIIRELPKARVLILGLPETRENVLSCIEAGVAGYVSKQGSLDDLITRIAEAIRGEIACSPDITRAAFSRLAELDQQRRNKEIVESTNLTAREMEILGLIAKGLSNKEIANQLCLSLHTVKNHVHHLLEKLSAKGRYAAVQRAYDKHWLKR
jgi:two-component system nitrate/nitrite response regulator NarL